MIARPQIQQHNIHSHFHRPVLQAARLWFALLAATGCGAPEGDAAPASELAGSVDTPSPGVTGPEQTPAPPLGPLTPAGGTPASGVGSGSDSL